MLFSNNIPSSLYVNYPFILSILQSNKMAALIYERGYDIYIFLSRRPSFTIKIKWHSIQCELKNND